MPIPEIPDEVMAGIAKLWADSINGSQACGRSPVMAVKS